MQKFNYSYRGLLKFAPWIIAVVAVVLLAFRWDTSAQRPAVVNPGRYQLFTGSHHVTIAGETSGAQDVFKIDTETGVTWVYRQVLLPNEKEPLEAWRMVLDLKRQ